MQSEKSTDWMPRLEPAPLSCMGGFCHVRGGCALYHEQDRRYPQERICARGFEMPEPMRVRAAPVEPCVMEAAA